ncbi:MAG TPA: hypothetical protein DCY13_08875 [Verrucomicrobiales bacterium]|nr:hypothetical protein [Verrucomicrobiales bacterium]
MFGTFRKHSTTLWVFLIAVIIVSFVIFFSPNVAFQSSPQQFSLNIDGRDFNRSDLDAAHNEARIAVMLGMARNPESNEEANMSALQRLLLRGKIAQYGIHVGDETTAAWIHRRLTGPTGPFAGQSFEQVVELLKPQGLKADDLQRFARNQAGLEMLIRTVVTPGVLVTPQEVEAAYLRDNEKIEAEVAFISHTNFAASVTLDPAEVAGFYSNRVAAYRSPDRVQVHFVRFAASNHLAEAEQALAARGGLEALINTAYDERGTNFYAGLTEAEAKARIRQEMIDQNALAVAKRKIYDFINGYWDTEPRSATVVATAAQAAGREMKTTEPFARDEVPEGLAVGPEFVDAAFKLTPSEPYSSAVVGADGYYALCFDQKIPGTIQPLESVRERVEKEYRENRSRTLAQEAADKFHAAATNAIAGGQSFAQLAEQAGFKYARIPDLSPRMTDVPDLAVPVDPRQIASLAFNQPTNSVGAPNYLADGMLVIRTGQRRPPSDEEMKEGMADYTERFRSARETEVFNEWMQQQMVLGGLQSFFSNPGQ